MTTIPSLMRQWRHILSINTKEAGARLGLSGRTIEEIEQGRRRSGDRLTEIALQSLIRDAEKSTRRRK